MVASSDPRWLQWAFNALVGLFERVGLRTNVGKTVSMTCRPCPATGNQSEVAYGRKMMGGGADISRETKRAGQVRGLREGGGGRVAGSPLDDTAWEGKGGQVELDRRSHMRRRGTTHLLDGVPDHGGGRGNAQWRAAREGPGHGWR